jgi:hypothetical protein
MRTWSRGRTLLLGVGLIVLTNAVILLGVASNRAGGPQSTLKLTQRELSLPSAWGFKGENNGIALRLHWRALYGEGDDYSDWWNSYLAWLNKAKLAELGFNVWFPEDTPEGRRHYAKPLPREVMLVLEQDGAAYQTALARARARAASQESLASAYPNDKHLKQLAKDAAESLAREENESSRLFVVDAGLDARALRAKYPNRAHYTIVRGKVEPSLFTRGHETRVVGGFLEVSIDSINVPLAFRHVFEWMLKYRKSAKCRDALRYEVSVAYGSRFEPWVLSASGSRPKAGSDPCSPPSAAPHAHP